MTSKTRNMFEGLVKEGSFKWLLGTRNSFDEEFEEMAKSPSARRMCIPELSPFSNVVVCRCSRILGISVDELQKNFDAVASDLIKHPSNYARNFLEYCCFRALVISTQDLTHLADKKFRRLTYNMMVAWEAPAPSGQALLKVDEEITVGGEAFARVAPAIPIIADVITCDNIFNVLTASTGGRLHFSVYEKYLSSLERAIRKLKTQSESSLLSVLRSPRGEKILEVDGTLTTQPVLQHVGISTWPGRLILTDHALYFEAVRVVSFDKAKTYDLSDDLKQVIKPELTGPWGTRLFDKAVMYRSSSLPEPVVMEFPELKGHTRRDYWLAISREILYMHRFIRKFQIKGVERDEALSKAVLGILRLQALQEVATTVPLRSEAILMFNLCDQLPGGDIILETLAMMSSTRDSDRTVHSNASNGLYSMSALAMMLSLGVAFGTTSIVPNDAALIVGEIAVGEMTELERAIREARNSYKNVILAQETVNGVKVDGVDTNIALMKELLFPVMELGKFLLSMAYWDDPVKSLVFCCVFTFVIFRGWLNYVFALMLLFIAIFMVLTRCFNHGRPVDEIKITPPPSKNAMEQLLAVQTAISLIEELVQDGNIVLLKLRALLLSAFPQASERLALALLVVALILALVPSKYVVLLVFLGTFTSFSPPRRASTEKWTRRLKEWWFSIPAAPVVLEGPKEEKKKK